MSEQRKTGRLKAEFLERIKTGEITIPPRKQLGSSKINAHVFTAIRDGEVVEWHYLVRFCRWLRIPGLTIGQIAEETEGPPSDPFMPDLLLRGWQDIFSFFRISESVHPFSFCDDSSDDDFQAMADLILDSLGWTSFSSQGQQKKASVAATRIRGEELSGLKFDDWVVWLRTLCRKEWRSVMFGVANVPRTGRYSFERLGASIVLPLTEATWHRFRDGQIGFSDLTGDDIERPSKHLLLHSMSSVRPSICSSGRKVSFALVRSILYQFATQCPVLSPDTWPSILCLAPLNTHQLRTQAYGFRRCETVEPLTKSGIWELIPSTSSGGVSGATSYGLMLATLAFFQFAFRDEVLPPTT